MTEAGDDEALAAVKAEFERGRRNVLARLASSSRVLDHQERRDPREIRHHALKRSG
jgi:hypothetical protein